MRTLKDIAGVSVAAQINALACAVIEGPFHRAESSRIEAVNLLHKVIAQTTRDDEIYMIKMLITAFVGASYPQSQSADRNRLMVHLSIARGCLCSLSGQGA